MCGLVSIFGYDDAPPIDAQELALIRDAMLVRGPDGQGLWLSADGRVGMGHRRLAIVDLTEAAAQPMASRDGHLRVIFNGEIYNYQQIRSRLEAEGYSFNSRSDTEVLLHLYVDRGPAMVRELRGMYAFVIWDQRRRRLIAARDPLGIKPLYYSDNGRTLRIASQVKALLSGGGIESRRDPAGEVGFLLWGYVPDPFTLHRNVRALPAGAMMIVEQGSKPALWSFCDLSAELAAAESGNHVSKAPDAVHERLHAALADSVNLHLAADVPVGIFQSAGLDSSTLTALAAENRRARLSTITLGFDEFRGTRDDETLLAARVANQYATEHYTRWLARDEFQAHFARMLAAMDQPSTDGFNTYFVAYAARELGVKAALSGIGGDEIFGGYNSFRHVPAMAGAWGRLMPRATARVLREWLAPAIGRLTSPKYAGLFEYAGTYPGAYLLRRALFMPWEIATIVDSETTRDGLGALETEASLHCAIDGIESPFVKVAALEMTCYMRGQLLRDADWAGMAHSVEIRTPFADLEVIRAIAPLAARGLLGRHKRDLAALPSRPLPKELVRRAKTGFGIPVNQWIANDGRRPRERGLRGWARHLAREFGFA